MLRPQPGFARRVLAAAGLMLGLVVPVTVTPASAAPNTAPTTYGASGKGNQPQVGLRSTQPRSSGALATMVPECPPVLRAKCSFDPALYQNHDPNDFTNYGNYDLANRPADGTKIKGVTIHDVEGTCEEAVSHYKDPNSFVSATYTICSDGRVIQSVPLKDVAWTAGNWWYNSHFVQIEHAGYASNPHGYTPQMYASSVLLVWWLTQKFGFPLDKAHVHGHDNVPATRTAGIARQHVDPGPFWNWQNYLAALRLGSPVDISGSFLTSKMVTIAPVWPRSTQTVTGCNVSNEVPPPCVPAGGPFSTNFVYLRTEPNPNAPFITDPVTGLGSTDMEDRAARAFYGSKFVVAERRPTYQGIWYKVWFGGQGAWFYSPYAAPTAFPTTGQCATPKGPAPVAVYGRPLPEKAEWDAQMAARGITPPAGSTAYPTPLAYTVQPGQCYAVIETVLPDHYFSWSYGDELERFRVTGQTPHVWVEYNGRYAFLKRSEVALVA